MQSKITEWAIANEPSDEYIYKKAWWTSIVTTRDIFLPIFRTIEDFSWDAIEKENDKFESIYEITGTHVSKSLILPVITFKYKNTVVTMRYNFYDWNVSVISDKNIDFPDGLFDKSKHNCFFQGFEDKYIIEQSYNDCKNEFSCCIGGHYRFFTFLFMLNSELDKGDIL